MVINMKNKERYITQLRNMNMFNEATYSYLHIFSFHKGEHVLFQGQELDYLYILMSGKLKTCHTTSNGSTVLIAFSYPITVIGEIELLNHREVMNDIYALEDSICLAISIELYKEELLNDLLFNQYLAKTISIKLYNSNLNTSISMNYPVENRLASYLIASHNNFIIQDNFVQVAEMIGCSYRQLQRTLNDFCHKKYIYKIKRGQFKVLNRDALKSLGQDLYNLK